MKEHALPVAVHTIAVAPNNCLALAGDAQGTLAPVDLRGMHSPAWLSSSPETLVDASALADRAFNLAVQGGVLGIDAAALRPILVAIGKTGSIKCAALPTSVFELTGSLSIGLRSPGFHNRAVLSSPCVVCRA